MIDLTLPPRWHSALRAELDQPYIAELQGFLAAELAADTPVFPAVEDWFAALARTAPEDVRVVILGQDPYHGAGQAHGLSFSVRPGVRVRPSLRNIYKELHGDLGIPPASHGYLAHWADQGVLLLNTTLTVRAASPASHAGRGWERLTDAVIRVVDAGPQPVVFLLWGAHARTKATLVDASRHCVLQSAHPSPLSARTGFFGSAPFSKANAFLAAHGRGTIDWALPAIDQHGSISA
ncbi:uracil-DNA glycosylase [Sphingomonas sp. Leaf33]|uniref:uracil-DNA glycosylase n=1 Tax=Sphingomonas sp. Leaf33 TaxID=1736215 RepID=UPI0006F8DF78|nr:uracil-DNA glycosylase [Sphingomonas sp. Leaf33]KQN24843.1 uracil-DNA glycosylase [Sphingomonas sp. Leaf33]